MRQAPASVGGAPQGAEVMNRQSRPHLSGRESPVCTCPGNLVCLQHIRLMLIFSFHQPSEQHRADSGSHYRVSHAPSLRGIPIDPYSSASQSYQPVGFHVDTSLPISPPTSSFYHPNVRSSSDSPDRTLGLTTRDYLGSAVPHARSQSYSHHPQSPPSAHEEISRQPRRIRPASARTTRSAHSPPFKHSDESLQASSPQGVRNISQKRHMAPSREDSMSFRHEDAYHHTAHWTPLQGSSTSVGMGIVGLYIDYITPFGPAHSCRNLEEGSYI